MGTSFFERNQCSTFKHSNANGKDTPWEVNFICLLLLGNKAIPCILNNVFITMLMVMWSGDNNISPKTRQKYHMLSFCFDNTA